MSAGSNSFLTDNIHLNPETIELIMGYLVENYTIDDVDVKKEIFSEHYIESEITNRLKD